MISWDAARVAEAAGARARRRRGRRADARGHRHARDRARRPVRRPASASAWTAAGSPPTRWRRARGACSSTPEHAAGLSGGAVLVADDPLLALQRLATAWRRALDAAVIGVTGSVGKTSTKQLIAALIAPHRRVAANPANFNTEIGLPLAVLAAPEGTEVLVLEMGMRGFGQIDELARIAEPDVGVITNIGPVHLELVGIARRRRAREGRAARARAGRDHPRRRPAARARTCATGSTSCASAPTSSSRTSIRRACAILARELRVELEVPFTRASPAREPAGRGRRGAGGRRGAVRAAWTCSSARCAASTWSSPSGVVVINDCYNANPLSMRAALDDLATQAPDGAARRRARRHARARARASWRRTARSARTRRRPASTCWSPSGRCRPRDARGVRRRGRIVAADAAEAAALVARLVRAGRRRAREGLARDRPGDGRGGAGPWVRS